MKFGAIYFFPLSVGIFFCGCSRHARPLTRVSIQLYGGAGEKLYLRKTPYIDEKIQLVDSGIAKNAKDSIIFTIPMQEDRLYEIQTKNAGEKVFFIADAPYLSIKLSVLSGKSTVIGSPATVSLNDFNTTQDEILLHIGHLKFKADSLAKKGTTEKGLVDSLQKIMNRSYAFFRERNLHYADTVSNPAAFLAVYNNLDFENNQRDQLRKLIQRASSRFSGSQPVQKLRLEVMDMISIYEQEYNVGDSLPSIRLEDINGNMFSTASLKGKYYLLDFWATWCERCAVYDKYKIEAKAKIPADKFELVSIALDDDKKTWIDLVRQSHYNWKELIDEKMWRGVAAKTLKFDSIPFNFLVSPQGRVLAKAIPPDSLITILVKTVR